MLGTGSQSMQALLEKEGVDVLPVVTGLVNGFEHGVFLPDSAGDAC